MSLQEKEQKIQELESKLDTIKNDPELASHELVSDVEKKITSLKEETYRHLSAYDHVYLARKPARPHIKDYINNLFDDFMEMHGDRYFGDDQAVVGGIATFNHLPVTVIGHQKGRSLDENMRCQFGMASPEGYRKGVRLMKQAEKFHRPIITFVDTPGAFPGIESEQNNIGEAIGQSLMFMSKVTVPVIVFVVGEGGSGGALALSVGNYMGMLENAVYSVISPEGCASILWKESAKAKEAAESLRMTADDALMLGVIERIIPEAGIGTSDFYRSLKQELKREVLILQEDPELLQKRYLRFRKLGEYVSEVTNVENEEL